MARLRMIQQASLIRPPWISNTRIGMTKSLKYISASGSNLANRQLCTSSTVYKYKLPEIPPEDEPFVTRSPYTDVEIPEINLADYVWQDVDKWPERTALVCLLF